MSQSKPAAHTQLHDGWGELILARPDRRNALVGPMVADLQAALTQLLAHGARAIVVRGEGGAFCSGLDVEAFGVRPAPDWVAHWGADWAAFHRQLYACPAVLICALERYAINGGASLALACDLLVAGEGAYLTVGEAALGMQAPMNIAWLRLRASEAVMAQLALGAARVTAADLLRLGLAYRVVPDATVAGDAQDLAARLAGFPGQGLAAIKASIRQPSLPDADIFAAVQATGYQTAEPSRLGD